MTASVPGFNLAHPVYLDTPMMSSFLAHLEGGLSTSEQQTQSTTGARERALSGRAGLRLKLWGIADADAGSEGSTQHRDENTLESKTERHHTAASLFNLLYEYLQEDKQLVDLRDPDQLASLRTGQLVEVSGEYLGNPFEDLLAFIGSIYPYINEPDDDAGPAARGSRSSKPAKRAAAAAAPAATPNDDSGIRIMLRMAKDIAEAPVHDLLFVTREGLNCVVTVASEFYSDTTKEYLRAGEFRVVGKVTKVVTSDESINLTRRAVMGAAGPEVTSGIIDSVRNSDGITLDFADPIVYAPAIQILPMAIFI